MFHEDTLITKIYSIIYVKGTPQGSHNDYHGNLNRYELIYKLDGECSVHFDGLTMNQTSGCIRYLPKGKNNEYYVDVITPGDCIDIFFDTADEMPAHAICRNFKNNVKIRNFFQRIQKIWSARKNGYYQECIGILHLIIGEILRDDRKYLSNEQYTLIRPAITYIEEHFTDHCFDYPSLHELCEISYTYFKNLFIKCFGIPPVKYVTNLRIQFACDLLHSKRYSITQIAEMTGYENVYYFSRVFKQHTGIAPKDYQNTKTI